MKVAASIERGLDRILTSPADRIQTLRRELQNEQERRRHRIEARSQEIHEALELAIRQLRRNGSNW